MKRNNILKSVIALIIAVFIFCLGSGVRAEATEAKYFRTSCETVVAESGSTRYQHVCKLYLKAAASELTNYNTIEINIEDLVKLRINTIVEADGWTKKLVSNTLSEKPVYSFTNSKPLSELGEVLFATYIFDVLDDGIGCQVVFSADYSKVETYICRKVGDIYYGPDGNEVSEKEYISLCKPYKCQKVGDNYYDADGNEVTEKEYNISCKKYNCQVVDGKYYNASGEEVTEEVYIAACKPYKCTRLDDKYYDDTGALVTEEVFREKCAPKCQKVGNIYFDATGKEVTEAEYISSCKPYKCEKVGDNYYDADGNQVTEEKYNESCNPKCKVVDGKYYNDKGAEVTEEEYTNICSTLPENPKTGLSLSIAFLVIITITSVFMYGYTRKENKLYK